jgi:hypothetical protein
MLKPQLYILLGKTALSLDGALRPNFTPLGDPVLLRRRTTYINADPKGSLPRLFPSDDFVWILPIFFKTPVKFVQLLLGDGYFVGIGR